MIEIELTPPEATTASLVATMQGVQNWKKAAKDNYGATAADEVGWIEPRVMSNMAEMAVAKALNLYWSGNVGFPGLPDVGGVVEVRAVRRATDHLILHPVIKKDGKKGDDPRLPYVLAHCLDGAGKFNLVGWIVGRDGQKDGFWQEKASNGRPAFWIPPKVPPLRPMSELVQLATDGLLNLMLNEEQAA